MEKAIDRKADKSSMLIYKFKDLVDLNRDKLSEYLKNEYYFKRMEEDLEDLGDNFEELKKFYFDVAVEFRIFVIEYDINHDNISENTIDIFLKQKAFTYLLSEKSDDEIIDYANDTPEIDKKTRKKDIVNVIKEKKDKEILKNNKKEQKLIDSLKDINKKQQETIDSLRKTRR